MGAAQFRQVFLQPLQSNWSSQFPPPQGRWCSHLQCKGDAHREGTDLVCRRVFKLLSGTDSYSDPFCRAAARGDFFSVSHSNDDILSCVYKWISDSPALGESKHHCKQTVSQ